MKNGRSTVLYVSYDGVLEPLGRSQVVNYLVPLAQHFNFHLLTFEKHSDLVSGERFSSLRSELSEAGITWHLCVYHKKPAIFSTCWDILIGLYKGFWIARKWDIKIIHARSYVPAFIALILKELLGVKFIFDIRGFWVDEKADVGLWLRYGYLFRIAKRVEKALFLNADFVISLTHSGVREISNFSFFQAERLPPLTVIPTCTDLVLFRKSEIKSVGFTLGYVGSASLWYDFDSAVRVFRHLLLKRPDSNIIIVNRGEHDLILSKLYSYGIPLERVELVSASTRDIPALINRMHAGVFFIKPVYSKIASSPTKLGEFLACGKPCLSNDGVGDMTALIERNNVGVIVPSFSDESLQTGLERLLLIASEAGISDRCRAVAEKSFSLDDGVKRYYDVYCGLL